MGITVWRGAQPPRRNKFNARRVPCEIGGRPHWHASHKERQRHWEIAERAQRGEIRDLVLQPRYELVVNGARVGRFTPDFAYSEVRVADGTIWWALVVEDVKGGTATKTEAYQLRKRVFEALYSVQVRET